MTSGSKALLVAVVVLLASILVFLVVSHVESTTNRDAAVLMERFYGRTPASPEEKRQARALLGQQKRVEQEVSQWFRDREVAQRKMEELTGKCLSQMDDVAAILSSKGMCDEFFKQGNLVTCEMRLFLETARPHVTAEQLRQLDSIAGVYSRCLRNLERIYRRVVKAGGPVSIAAAGTRVAKEIPAEFHPWKGEIVLSATSGERWFCLGADSVEETPDGGVRIHCSKVITKRGMGN